MFMKLHEARKISFKVEEAHFNLLQEYCDDNEFNMSAVLRRMLIDFLKYRGVLDDS